MSFMSSFEAVEFKNASSISFVHVYLLFLKEHGVLRKPICWTCAKELRNGLGAPVL